LLTIPARCVRIGNRPLLSRMEGLVAFIRHIDSMRRDIIARNQIRVLIFLHCESICRPRGGDRSRTPVILLVLVRGHSLKICFHLK
jgi:hypothetical protein